MDFFETVRSRRSVRRYSPEPIEGGKLDAVLEAGILAPSAKNLQPIRIYVIDTARRREALARVYRGPWLLEAPLVLAVAADTRSAWRRSFDEKSSSDIDAAIVMDHMVLAATALGLGTCWICAFDPREAALLLGLQEGWEAVALSPLGYPAESPAPRGRRSRVEIVREIG